jgi:hypothetical protein
MPPAHPREFGGGGAETLLNPFVAVVLIVAVILILSLPRKYVVVPLLFAGILVPIGQVLVVAGLHLYVGRLLVIVALARGITTAAFSRLGLFGGGSNTIDRAFLCATVWQASAAIILFGSIQSLVNQCGFLLDVGGMYLVLRFFIRSNQDAYRSLKCLAMISAAIAVCMAAEQMYHVNVFSLVCGGRVVPEFRGAWPRSQGPFEHPLLAGTFGATLAPLMLILWSSGKTKSIAAIGLSCSIIMTITANSSTPLLTFASGISAICLWPLRKRMRTVRLCILTLVLGMSSAMKAPVWFLLAHIDLVGGSSGYHRAELIDQFAKHFRDWWLLGVKDTSSWGWDLWDAQNQYVAVGETGGLLALTLFILTISRSFGGIGEARRSVQGSTEREWLLWLLGASLFAHVVAFFGVNYFDQSRIAWLLLLAVISTAAKSITPISFQSRSGGDEHVLSAVGTETRQQQVRN